MTSKLRIMLSMGSLAAVVAVVGGLLWSSSTEDAGASQSELFGAAVAELGNDDGSVAATVNGVAIPAAKLRAFMVFNATGKQFGVSGQPRSLEDYRDQLIEQELMYQEAVRRGLIPSDSEVLSFASTTKGGLEQLLREDTSLARDLQGVFDQVKGTPYHLDAYDSSPQMLEAFRKQMAVGMLRNHLMASMSGETARDAESREAAFARFAADLRADAEVRIP